MTDEPAKTMKPEMPEPKPLIEEMQDSWQIAVDARIGHWPTVKGFKGTNREAWEIGMQAAARVMLARMREYYAFPDDKLDAFAREHGLDKESGE